MSLPPEQVSLCASFNEQKTEKNVWHPRLGHKRHIASACVSLLWCSPLEKTTVLWGCPQAHAGDHLDRIWGLPPLSPSWAPRDCQQQGAGRVSESSGKRVPQPSVNCPDWCSMEHDGAIPPSPAQRLTHLPTMWETQIRSLGWEDPLEKQMATHSSIRAWRIPWTEEPGRLQSTGRKELDTTERLHCHFLSSKINDCCFKLLGFGVDFIQYWISGTQSWEALEHCNSSASEPSNQWVHKSLLFLLSPPSQAPNSFTWIASLAS